MPSAAWLPEPLAYADFSGDWSAFIAAVFGIFTTDFVASQPMIGGKPIIFRRDVQDGYPMGFWHIVSELDQTTGDRNPDLRRCERVGWARETIVNCGAPEIRCWRNSRAGRDRVLLWVPADDYVLILEELPKSFKLITAYCQIQPGRALQFETEWKAYQTAGATPC